MMNTGIIPPLCGLILAGGLSSRMGKDKHVIRYHKDPQWKRLIKMLETLKIKPFIACRPDQSATFALHNCIFDRDKATGPISPIRSALSAFPSKSWLVIASDMPGIDHECLEKLITHRNPAKQATTFFNVLTNRPEPLLCIYESKITSELMHRYHSPSKLLLNLDIQLVRADPACLININTPEEYQSYLKDNSNQG